MSGIRNPNIEDNNTHSNSIIFRENLPLRDLAFKAFLRARQEIDFEPMTGCDEVIQKQAIKHLLSHIADANPIAAKDHLAKCPESSFVKRDTITTASGYTYEDVSAIELIYLMDDDEMLEMALDYIKELPIQTKIEIYTQLTHKMAEVEKQRAQFKPYDFSEIVLAITNDQSLKDKDIPTEATLSALAKLKNDFTPDVIKQDKSWIKEQLEAACQVYLKNAAAWPYSKCRWYLINVSGYIQTLVETCFEQECSQGLVNIVVEKQPNTRNVKVKEDIGDKAMGKEMTYRGATDLSLRLGCDFFVEFVEGKAMSSIAWYYSGGASMFPDYYTHKKQRWDLVLQHLADLIDNQQQYSAKF